MEPGGASVPARTLKGLALAAPPGRRREEMLLGLLALTPDASRGQKAIAAQTKVPKQELLEHQLRASQLRAAKNDETCIRGLRTAG